MPRLSSSAREKLYDAEAAKALASGRGEHPICVHCGNSIDGRRDRWNVAHDPQIPDHMGGEIVGIAHERCNFQHNHDHDTPLYFKIKRNRQRHIGARVTQSRPMLGTKASGVKKPFNGNPVYRNSGRQWP